MSTTPLQIDPDELKRNLAITLGSQAPVLPEHLGMPAGPQMAAPGPVSMPDQGKAPNLAITPPPTVKGPRGTLDADKAERSRMISTGPGESQIYGKVTGSQFGQNHPVLGKILGGLGQVGATLGDIGISAVAPGIAAAIPGTAYHHAQELRGVNKQIGAEEGEAQKEAETAREQAQIPMIQAQTENLRNPPDKFSPLSTEQGIQAFDPKTGEAKPLQGAGGEPLKPFSPDKNKNIDEQAYESLVAQGKTPVEALDTIYGSKNTKTEDLPHLYLDALQKGDATAAALIKRAHEDTQVKPTQPPGITMIVPDPNNPGGGVVQRLTAGQTVAPGAQTAAGVNALNTPTTQQRNVEAQAQLVHKETPQVLQQLDQLKQKLGPVEGRWNEFMQGKVGMEDGDMADLRSNLLMYSSAVALMHARGRLPENLRKEFDDTINAPKQSAENLKRVISRIDQWTVDNINTMGGNRQGQPAATPGAASGLGVSLKDAMALPQFKGKSEQEVRQAIEAHGHKVIE